MARGKKRKTRAGHTTEASLPLVAFHIVLPSSQPPYGKIGTLSIDNGDGNENSKKAISFFWQITTLHVHHAFLYIS